jgi:hypothetical protein
MVRGTDAPESVGARLADDLLTGLGMTAILIQIRSQIDWMQQLMLLSLLCLLPSSGMASQSVSLAWDPNSETNLAGYVIYYGTASGHCSSSNNVGNTTNT